jgi:UDP-glucose 4-epimerase
MKSEPVLVTGVGGLIGAAVVKRLVAEGVAVVAADCASPSNVDLGALGVPFFAHDLPDPPRWDEVIGRFGIRRVVHAGGISGPMVLGGEPGRVCAINLGGVVGLLEAARRQHLDRIVWFSSINAYGDQPDLAPVKENTTLLPNTVYGATKAAGEALILAYAAEHDVDAIALRVTSCYGPGRTTPCLIRTLVADGLTGRTSYIHSMEGRTRQHIFIDDVVQAVELVLNAPALRQRIYNVGPGRAQTLDEIVDQVRVAVPATTVVIGHEGLVWNTFGLGPLAIDAAQRDFGFQPTVSIADGAAAMRDWLLKGGDA